MKILYLAHRIPYPPNKGDKIRSFNEIKYLSNSHEIDLVCLADNPGDFQYQRDLKRYCRRIYVLPFNTTWAKLKGMINLATGKTISVGYFYSRKLQQIFDQWLAENNYDAIICFSSPMAEYLFRTSSLRHRFSNCESQDRKSLIRNPKSEIRNPKLVMDFCDVDSHKWAQYAELKSFPKSFIYRLEHLRLAAFEKRVAEQFDHAVFVSEREAEIFLNKNSHLTNVAVIPNGVDYDYFSPARRSKVHGTGHDEPSRKTLHPEPYTLHPILLFTGAMDYHANVDGVTWFCKKILPEIRVSIPKLNFYIVGSNPGRKVKNLNNGNAIKVTGFVEDIRSYYRQADVCVIPLRLARGIQNKVLEAMSMEKAVVTTPQAIQGITARDQEHLIVANSSAEFVEAVSVLLHEENRRRELGTRARQFVRSNYHWQTNMSKLEELLITRRKESGERHIA